MFARFSRSFELMKFSAGLLRQDKHLLVFPLLSGIAAILVLVSFIPVFMTGGEFVAEGAGAYPENAEMAEAEQMRQMLFLGLFYLVEYFVIFFFNSALVGAALIRLQGGSPTIGDGLRIAMSKIGHILGYAMIAATVGVILRAISERVGFIGQIVVGLIGTGWTVATYLVVPVLVSRDIGPMDAVKESVALLKKTWGENIIANAGLGVVFFLFYIMAAGFFIFLAAAVGSSESRDLLLLVFGLFVATIIVLALIHAALQGIFSAALYQYAVEGDSGDREAPQALANAFAPK
ncbi:MAG: DUF6159 family protein [Gammaproteobacteria bacterium]|nr:DUF6159 family protein [Gammaproteobacteria bacterium]